MREVPLVRKEYIMPLPPSLNKYRYKNFYKNKESIKFENDIRPLIENTGSFGDQRLCVIVEVHFKTAHKADLDNREKLVFDLFTKYGVWNDDSQIDNVFVRRMDIVKGGKMRMIVLAEEFHVEEIEELKATLNEIQKLIERDKK